MAIVGKDMALLTAGDRDNFNALTVMFGATGMIWLKDVYLAFIKPERYTWEFVNNQDYFTVSYFPKEYNRIHKVFGYQSGRDVDKVKATGITPEYLEHGITFAEAEEIFVCKKLYVQQLDKASMPSDVIARYDDPNDIIFGEPHYLVIGEIVDHILR